MEFTPSKMTQKLAQAFDPTLGPESPYPKEFIQARLQPASVLLPLLQKDQEWHLLFIRRTHNERDHHRGQVAYPGGRRNLEDTDSTHTALREACEETGITPKDVQVLGRLRDMVTITCYRVTPIVGVIPWPYPLVAQPSEVSRIFTIPLKWLVDPKNREARYREFLVQGKQVPVIYYQPYDGETLWGASARITLLFLESLGLSSPDERYY